ncbi:NAD(P)/FAD-dependent oxidoreductase [Nocardioides sp. cx-169]|uniref:flavin-containing monooxygenase n=1 Tax=Nocardioides sp. cx-169 TaxID=2899080 RepID=UPI001E34E8DE|nr:NAD(P)/FAD-dependent oxidoreductase [Nocardioides sp. cx-169]MCD4536598.1 NAD(P)/FAD-dependent oxidoreductase [Nocardioides sp. cx-169]
MSASKIDTQIPGEPALDTEVIIVGAGILGIHQLHRALQEGFSATVLEAGDGVGGVWYWNRYPGARLDSESYTYGYLLTKELFEGWKWSELFAAQPENEAYLNYAVDQLGLRQHIQFGARVTSATYDESSGSWLVRLDNGQEMRCRFLISATGPLSAPIFPSIPGREDFEGISHHTGQWPKEPVDFRGKRVAVIGTGASGVQVIPAIADEVASVTVYQRTPNWCTPLNNRPLSAEEHSSLNAEFENMREALKESGSGFLHEVSDRAALDDPKEVRLATYEKMWNSPGFAKFGAFYSDITRNKAVNDEFSEFIANKIRAIVNDPATADKLIPTDHGWAGKRPPFVTNYYEAFNKPNVSLIDTESTPIVRVTERGIETTDGSHDFDIIVWATGFDFGTGSLVRMGIRGRDGRALEDHWADGPSTYAGTMAHGFPNFFFIAGPHGSAGNVPRYGEHQIDFITDLIRYARDNGHTEIDVPVEIENKWNAMVDEYEVYSSFGKHSFFYGANVEGKATKFLSNPGGRQALKKHYDEAVESKYNGFFA